MAKTAVTLRKLTHEEIVTRQVGKMGHKRLPFCAVLDNIRSLHNVGAMFRTADAVGLEKIWLCGATGYPPQGGIAKTALGAEDHVPWEYRADALSVVRGLRSQGYQIVLLEQMQGSLPYHEFIPKMPVCLVIGNEISGVADGLVALGDAAIEIGMAGIKNSLNAAVAFGVAAYQIRCKIKG